MIKAPGFARGFNLSKVRFSDGAHAFFCVNESDDSSTPYFMGDVADQANFCPLLFFSEDVALFGRGKAALCAEAQPVQRQIATGLFDARYDDLTIFQFAYLGRHQAQYHLLAV